MCVFQVGIVSYGETVTHRVNLSQFDNTPALLEFVEELPQQTGFKTMTFLGIDTARYSTLMNGLIGILWDSTILNLNHFHTCTATLTFCGHDLRSL